MVEIPSKKRKPSTSSDAETEDTASPGLELVDQDKQTIEIVNELTDTLTKIKHCLVTSCTDRTLKMVGIVPEASEILPLLSYGIERARPYSDELAEYAAPYRAMMPNGASISSDEFENMYRSAQRYVSILEEGGRRMHVYPFLLRVAAMLEDSGHLLIFPNYTIPSTQLHGPDEARTVQLTLDYLLVLLPKTQRADAHIVLQEGADVALRRANGFAILQAKPPPSGPWYLTDAWREALLAVAALAKQHRLPIMHGAVTNGIMWQFFTFTPKPDGVGGTYLRSVPVDASWSSNSRAVLTGILKDMIESASAVVRTPAQAVGAPAQNA